MKMTWEKTANDQGGGVGPALSLDKGGGITAQGGETANTGGPLVRWCALRRSRANAAITIPTEPMNAAVQTGTPAGRLSGRRRSADVKTDGGASSTLASARQSKPNEIPPIEPNHVENVTKEWNPLSKVQPWF
jgi:hypothetical protein